MRRYIYSNLAAGQLEDTYKQETVAGDISFYYTGIKENGSGWNFGAALTNLGTKIGYTNDANQGLYPSRPWWWFLYSSSG